MIKRQTYGFAFFISFLLLFAACNGYKKTAGNTTSKGGFELPKLKISKNQHYFVTQDEKPFFWLGDTGWLLFSKLKREEAAQYLEDRKQKGFNVIQVMVIHSVDAVNAYGDKALEDQKLSKPVVTPGNDIKDATQYDFWDHVDYVVKLAEEKGLYIAMVPVWGTNVSEGKVTKEEAKIYSEFLTKRYKDKSNIIWLNGGDTFGNEFTDVWNTIGETIKQNNPDVIQTFHPRGRMTSSDWFHTESWLDFNMVQSGHRRYDQDDSKRAYGQDNYRYIATDFNLKPTKPTLDGEPSYEGIPEGLHDTLQRNWNHDDVRRYGYWSVFAGAAGYTYGHNAVMQMHRKTDKAAYGNKALWTEALDAPGAKQMLYIKKLMLDFPYLERVPDQSLIADQGEKYDYLVATRGKEYAMVYTYNGRKIVLNMGKIDGDQVAASWYNPRNGKTTTIGNLPNKGIQEFQPSGSKEDGNDWVLILKSKK
ncbi:glycoside hydrolase family 140 protein [Flavobacterium sp. XS2P39]|uniref:glycoside hydrolase family 140 protein n=1 Tax=Flavobacterium sp. XS2P39 TaxID=3401725 RepID=UPI003AAA2350